MIYQKKPSIIFPIPKRGKKNNPRNPSNPLFRQLTKLLSNSKLIKKYQKKAWAKYEFNSSKLTKKQDSIRLRIIKDFYLKK